MALAALLSMLAVRLPAIDELVGAARVLRSLATPITPPPGVKLLDTCGTGGAPKVFNISTISAIVAASAAPGLIAVPKHGNRSRTGRGSAEVLEALGVNIHATPVQQERCLREIGVCFSFAPAHHPAVRHVSAIRKKLPFPTIFNLLGPLANPAGARHQLIGVYSYELARRVARALAQLGCERGLVVHGADGLDELSTTGPNRVFRVDGTSVREDVIDSEAFGLRRSTLADLAVDSLEGAVNAAREVFAASPGSRQDVVLLNAGAALALVGAAETHAAGVELARRTIKNRRSERTLNDLVRLSTEPA